MWRIVRYVRIILGNIRLLWYKCIYHKNIEVQKGCQISNLLIRINSSESKIIMDSNVRFRRNCIINMSSEGVLEIGKNTFINDYTLINVRMKIAIGDNVCIGQNVKFYDHDHCYGGDKGFKDSAIFIGENTWIGTDCIILRGTQIGKNCVIGAGSIVKGVVPDNTVFVNERKKSIKRIDLLQEDFHSITE